MSVGYVDALQYARLARPRLAPRFAAVLVVGAVLTGCAARSIPFESVRAGPFRNCAIATRGTAYCWGYEGWGSPSGRLSTERPTPVPGASELAFHVVSAIGNHTCGLTESGVAYCWGFNNQNGQLGIGSTDSHRHPTPARVSDTLALTSISVGGNHTCAVTNTGDAYCWGFNDAGQLGDGTTSSRSVPVQVRLGR